MGPTAFLDMPWLPIFVIALFLFHPLIGLAAVFGAVLIVSTTLLAERQSKALAKAAADRGARRAALADAIRRNAEAIHALGMRGRFMSAWCRLNEAHIAETTRMRDIDADIGAIAKVLRYVLQSAILGIGAALVVGDQASGGIMIASSIMMGRALRPSRSCSAPGNSSFPARQAVDRLGRRCARTCVLSARGHSSFAPPAPVGATSLRHAAGIPSLVTFATLLRLPAGTGLALLGASGSGKSSLAKALVGIWPARGSCAIGWCAP